MSASPKRAKSALSKKIKMKSLHPKTADMVKSAIKKLKENNGSSLQAIKKYMAATFKVDTKKHAPFIKRYIKSALKSGALVQTKGKGASGSFKLPVSTVKRVAIRLKTAKKALASKKSPALKKARRKLKNIAGKRSGNATVQKKKMKKRSASKSRNAKASKAKSPSKSSRNKVRIAAPRKSKLSLKTKRSALSMK